MSPISHHSFTNHQLRTRYVSRLLISPIEVTTTISSLKKLFLASTTVDDVTKKALGELLTSYGKNKSFITKKSHLVNFILDNEALIQGATSEYTAIFTTFNRIPCADESSLLFCEMIQHLTDHDRALLQLQGPLSDEHLVRLQSSHLYRHIIQTENHLIDLLLYSKQCAKNLIVMMDHDIFFSTIRMTFPTLKIMLSGVTPSQLHKKLTTIIDYNTNTANTIKLEGSALGFALQYGSAEELHKKLTTIIDYNTNTANTIKLEGSALGLALQYGSAEELHKKLNTIIDYNTNTANTIKLEGSALGLLLTKKLYQIQLYIKERTQLHFCIQNALRNNASYQVLSGQFFHETFFVSLSKFLSDSHHLKSHTCDEYIQILETISFQDIFLVVDSFIHFKYRRELYNNLKNTISPVKKLDDGFLFAICSFFTNYRQLSTRQLASVQRVFRGEEVGHGYDISIDKQLGNSDLSLSSMLSADHDDRDAQMDDQVHIEALQSFLQSHHVTVPLYDVSTLYHGIKARGTDSIATFWNGYLGYKKIHHDATVSDFMMYVVSLIN